MFALLPLIMSDIETEIIPRYADLTDKINELKKQIKELNKSRKGMEDMIQESMEKSGKKEFLIPDLNIAIRAKEKDATKAATKADIIEGLADTMGLNAEEVAMNIESFATKTKKVKITIGKVSRGRVTKHRQQDPKKMDVV